MAVSAAVGCAGVGPDVERELRGLARARGPLRRVLAELAARFAAREGWAALGYARLGDYARERLGVSDRSLQEWARVGEKLRGLPELEAALVSGDLSWSAVRDLARVVEPVDEREWIAFAADLCAHTLQRELRAVERGVLDGGTAPVPGTGEEMRWLAVRVSLRTAFAWRRACEEAAKVEGRDLCSGEVLERVLAEAMGVLPAEVVGEGVAPELREGRERCGGEMCAPLGSGGGGAAELPAFLRSLLEGLDGADPHELDARLRRAVRLEQRLDADLARVLRVASSAEYERCRSVAALADEVGMSTSKARALVRIERVGEVCSALRERFRDGSLSWVQAQELVPLLRGCAEEPDGSDWRASWAEFAGTISVRGLKEAVGEARWMREADPVRFDAHRGDPEYFAPGSVRDDAEEQICAPAREEVEDIRLSIVASADVAGWFEAVVCAVRRGEERETGRLATEGEVFGAMVEHALSSWGIDERRLRRQIGAVRYEVLERDRWRCVFPGCTSRRNLQVHHVRFRAAGGGDELENLVTLCAFHHVRGVHGGTVRVTGRAPDRLTFEVGVRAGGAPLVRYRSGDRVLE